MVIDNLSFTDVYIIYNALTEYLDSKRKLYEFYIQEGDIDKANSTEESLTLIEFARDKIYKLFIRI